MVAELEIGDQIQTGTQITLFQCKIFKKKLRHIILMTVCKL